MNLFVSVCGKPHCRLGIDPTLGEGRCERSTEGMEVDPLRGWAVEVERVGAKGNASRLVVAKAVALVPKDLGFVQVVPQPRGHRVMNPPVLA